MMKNRYLAVGMIFCLGIFIAIFSNWDAIHPPHFANYYNHVIVLEFTYGDGERGSFILDPGTTVFNREKGRTCASMKVYSEDEVLLAEYPEDVIAELKVKSIDDHEFWVLSEKGVFLKPKGVGIDEYLEMIYAIMKYNCGSENAAAN